MFKVIHRAWRWLRARLGRGVTGYKAVTASDAPDDVEDGVLYLVGEDGNLWLAAMRCPCRCGEDIQLAMSSSSRPRWVFSGTLNKPTLAPSVWRKSGCRSHFFLRGGKVLWAKPA